MQNITYHTSQGAATFAMAMCMPTTHATRPPGRRQRIR
jgi:hypothetical protein